MTALAHGKKAPVLADGSSLLQQVLLSPEQSIFARHDTQLLRRAAAFHRNARIVNVGVRSLVVASLVTVAVLIFTENINHFIALGIVIPLMFATDASTALIAKVTAKRTIDLKELKLYSVVSGMANAHFFNKSVEQRKDAYLTLLTTGKMLFSTEDSYRLVLTGGTDTPHTLSYVVG